MKYFSGIKLKIFIRKKVEMSLAVFRSFPNYGGSLETITENIYTQEKSDVRARSFHVYDESASRYVM